MAHVNSRCRAIACLVITVGLLSFTPTEVTARSRREDSLAWFVRIYPNNTNFIEIMMDPRRIPSGYYISGEIRYEVSFYTEQNRLLGTKVFSITKEAVDGRRVYRHYAPHPYRSAKRVKGGTAHYTIREVGVLFHLRPPTHLCNSEQPKTPENYSDQEALVVNWKLLEKFRTEQLNVYPYLIRDVSGKFRPAGGYRWVNPNDPGDSQVMLMPNLTEGKGGVLTPAGGYRWVNPNEPHDFRVVLMPGLIKRGDGKLRPAGGYTWVDPNDPHDFCVQRIQ